MYRRIMLITFVLILTHLCLRDKMNRNIYRLNGVKDHLGTRTPYRFRSNKNDTRIEFKQCKDKKIWMMVRHGTRLPSAKDIIGVSSTLEDLRREIILHHNLGKGVFSSYQIQYFIDWHLNLSPEDEKELTLEGKDEMVLLAERMMNRFPSSIPSVYNNNTFAFRYTATKRAQRSARAFTLGLFDKKANDIVFQPATKNDPILRFYKHCDRWQVQVKNNASTYMDQELFGISKQMNNSLETISKRVGLNYVLRLDQLILAYKICGYETSWNMYRDSPWCFLFEEHDAQRFEYYFDLKHYWIDGYGHQLTYKLACSPMRAMFDTFSNEKGANATFLFAHSGTLLKLLAHLQLYRPDSPLRGDEVDSSRTWRASNIDCFGTNLAFVLYRCQDGDHVLTLHQEQIIKLPICDKELCSLEHLKNYFHDSIHNCNLNELCKLD